MANLPISQLPEVTQAPEAASSFAIVQNGATSRIQVSNLMGPYITTGSLNETQTIQGFLQWKDDSNVISGYIASFNSEVGSLYLRSGDDTKFIAVYNDGISLVGNITSSGNISSSGNLIINEVTASGNISSSGYISASQIRTPFISSILGNITTLQSLIGTFGTATTVIDDNISSSGYVLANNMTASGNISSTNIITNNITASGNISASGTIFALNISSSGNVNFSGNISASNISASGWISGSDLVITNNSILGNTSNLDNVRITGSLYVSGSNIRFDNDTNYNGIEFTGSTDFSRDITVRDDLFVKDETTLDKEVTIGYGGLPNSDFSYQLNVTASSNHVNSANFDGGINITGSISASGNISASATIKGNNIIAVNQIQGNDLDVVTFGYIGDYLEVNNSITSSIISASSTLSGQDLIVSKNTTLGTSANFAVPSLIKISGSLSTTGSVKMQGNGRTASEFKALEVTGSAGVSDDFTVGDDLRVKDETKLDKQVKINYGATATNYSLDAALNVTASSNSEYSANFDGSIQATGSLDVLGAITASGNISSSGKLFGGLVSSSQPSVVFYNNSTGELTYATSESIAGSGGAGGSSFTADSISGSWQGQNFISGSQVIENLPSGTISSSNQITASYSNLSGASVSGSWQGQNFISGSQVIENLPSGTISSSNQITASYSNLSSTSISGSFLLNTTDTLTGDLNVTNHITASGNIKASGKLFGGLVSSSQPSVVFYNDATGELTYATSESIAGSGGGGESSFTAASISGSWQGQNFISGSQVIENLPSGTISSSNQITASYSNLSSTTVSGSWQGQNFISGSQVIENLPSGTISSSNQITASYSNLSSTSISGSFLLNTTDTLTGDLNVTNHITASGNIKASGRVIPADGVYFTSTDYIRTFNDQIQIKSAAESIALNGNITASANVSASGKLFGGLVSSSQPFVVFFKPSTGELTYATSESIAGSGGGGGSVTGESVSGSFLLKTTDTLTGDLNVTNHITASGNISSSGDIAAVNGAITNITSSGHIISTSEFKLVGSGNYYTTENSTGAVVAKVGADLSGNGEIDLENTSGVLQVKLNEAGGGEVSGSGEFSARNYVTQHQSLTSAGTAVGDATLISATGGGIVFATVGGSSQGFKLPALNAVTRGTSILIHNISATATRIYPNNNAGTTIIPLSEGAFATLPASQTIQVTAYSNTEWVGFIGGIIS